MTVLPKAIEPKRAIASNNHKPRTAPAIPVIKRLDNPTSVGSDNQPTAN